MLAPSNRTARKAVRRRVAVCLAGMAPPVVTESLYALTRLARPRIAPDRVFILTTSEALGSVVSTLLGKNGAIERLKRDYNLPAASLACPPDHVVVLRDARGRPLADLRNNADSVAAGEHVARFLGKLRSDPQIELHCSLAGGRKTMGALLALALQLVARPGDRLYHVLVNEPFERVPDFFYPPPRPRRFRIDGRTVSSREARIELAEIPMVRLGAVAESLGLGREDLARRAARIEAAMHRSFPAPRLVLDAAARTVRVDEEQVRLSPQLFLLYELYAGLRARCSGCRDQWNPRCASCQPTDGEIFENHRGELLSRYERRRRGAGDSLARLLASRAGTAREETDFDEWLRGTRSRINRVLNRLPATAGKLGPCRIEIRDPGSRRRGLGLPGRMVSVRSV